VSPEPVLERAHAKLNPFLRVLGRRDDGDHDVETVLLPLELHDLVTIEPATGFSVRVDGPRAEELERAGGESIVTRAVEAYAAATGLSYDVAVVIEKRIPVAAGMGGGSADAAAVLRGLARLHGTAASALPAIAATVGADVPALLRPAPCFADGRGDRVVEIHAVTTQWAVKSFGFGVRAADAYGWWDEAPATGPDPGALIAALETGNLEVLGDALYDDLMRAVLARHAPVGEAIAAFREAGALGAVMTGSGPTVVALAANVIDADRLASAVPGAFATSGPPRTMDAPHGAQSGVV
jgi:4-diphosphocytidyl-2-C-methyl-D-erythritol kinase